MIVYYVLGIVNKEVKVIMFLFLKIVVEEKMDKRRVEILLIILEVWLDLRFVREGGEGEG